MSVQFSSVQFNYVALCAPSNSNNTFKPKSWFRGVSTTDFGQF